MDNLIIFVFLSFQVVVGTISYRRWIKQKSQLQIAKSQILNCIIDRHEDGTLKDYLEGIVYQEGLTLAHRNNLRQACLCGGALFLGIAFMFIILRILFPGSHILFKALITSIGTTPFVFLASIGIAQEFDDIRIMDFAKSMRNQILQHMDDNDPKKALEELLMNVKQ